MEGPSKLKPSENIVHLAVMPHSLSTIHQHPPLTSTPALSTYPTPTHRNPHLTTSPQIKSTPHVRLSKCACRDTGILGAALACLCWWRGSGVLKNSASADCNPDFSAALRPDRQISSNLTVNWVYLGWNDRGVRRVKIAKATHWNHKSRS